MSVTMDDSIKRWTAKRKTALVVEIIQGKTTVAEASRAYDLSLNRPGFTGGQNSRRIARYGTDIKEENREAVFT